MKLGTAINICFAIIAYLIDFGGSQLHESFRYYEIVNQNHFRHNIKKRSTGNNFHSASVEINFKNNSYRLELQRDDSLFRSDFKVFSVDEKDVATEIQGIGLNLFHGHVAGMSGRSKVSALFEDDGKLGSFVVMTNEDTFAAEPLESYDSRAKNGDDFVIYSQRDVRPLQNEERKHRTCGNSEETGEEIHHKSTSQRDKRSTHECQNKNRKACTLYVAVDYPFFSKVGRGSLSVTGKIVVSIIDYVNEIFKGTTFDECGQNFGFQIQKMYIYQNHSENENHFNHPKQSPQNSREFLRSFGAKEFSSELQHHCLGHLFTAIPMQRDVLGLSNIPTTRNNEFGLCAGSSANCKSNCKHFLNTGFTSFVDSHSKRLPSLQATLVAAHELGHSFGSHHDDTSCTQDKYPGFYLMYAYSVSGAEPNNKLFSNCSIKEIKGILKSKTASCLTAYNTSFCGNYRIEGTEECDDGFGGSKCCSDRCILLRDSQCGLNQECCTDCKFSKSDVRCRNSSTCLGDAFCSGSSAFCLKPSPINTNSSCRTKLSYLPGRCYEGECTDLCELNDQLTCLCHGEDMCKLCCMDKDLNSTCELYNNEAQDLPDGTACAFGVCESGQCKKTEVSQVQRLWPIIDIKNISSLVIFTKNNIVGLVLIFSLMVWIPASCYVVHLDKKNIKEELETLQWMSISQTSFLPEKSKIKVRHSAASH